ncbi:MAG: hypothetical protein WKF89_02065 [Chitinophagaceae bacterium]
MKNLIALITTFFLSLALFANKNPGRLVITNMENTTLRITVDGRKYDGIDKTLTLNDLSAGDHHIKVYKIRRGWFANDQLMYSSAVFFNPGYQVISL